MSHHLSNEWQQYAERSTRHYGHPGQYDNAHSLPTPQDSTLKASGIRALLERLSARKPLSP